MQTNVLSILDTLSPTYTSHPLVLSHLHNIVLYNNAHFSACHMPEVGIGYTFLNIYNRI